MAGDNRIVAFGASGGESTDNGAAGAGASDGFTETPHVGMQPEAEEASWDSAWTEASGAEPSRQRGWIAPTLALAAGLGWTALFLASNWPELRSGVAFAYLPGLITQWCVPVILIGLLWLLAMRHSAREGRRFGDIARELSTESARLEARLTAVNRELSLAREFVASQSRDLEALGRIAAERLSQNAERLQELVRENGNRVETIGTVSSTALENMEKLRGQLPVIASSAKDVANNIGNTGRTAQSQLEELQDGFVRLRESGLASEAQVGALRDAVETALTRFAEQCEHIEQLASQRFAALTEQGQAFRTELELHEVEALASVRTRSTALQEEIAATRQRLDAHEAESLTSLRARLAALRDESEVVSRALRDAETRASEALQASLFAFETEQAGTSERIAKAQQSAVDMLAARLSSIAAEADKAATALDARASNFSIEAEERQSRQVEQERHAIARIEHMLGELDGSIAERLERHRLQAEVLTDRARAVTHELEQYEARLRSIATQSGESEARLTGAMATVTGNLTSARATLSSTESDLVHLTEGSVRLLELVQASAKHAHTALPEAIAVSEDRIARLNTAVTAVLDLLTRSADQADDLSNSVAGSDSSLRNLIARLESAQGSITARGEDHVRMLTALSASLDEIEAASAHNAERASGELSQSIAVLRTALEDAVTSIEQDASARISGIAEALGAQSGEAIDKAMRTKVAEISGQLEQAVAHASGVTREATIQLRDQLARVDDLVGNLENRVSHARERAEEQVDNDFARRVALITESLNSNAIDIAKALSTDISDTAWASYLRGDRGIFTRRAVSLIDASEVKSIQQIYERDDAFREHVSRYIHDFEAILRQVLSTRDGNALGVTLLSSDMGKLYVALAQGIERLRG